MVPSGEWFVPNRDMEVASMNNQNEIIHSFCIILPRDDKRNPPIRPIYANYNFNLIARFTQIMSITRETNIMDICGEYIRVADRF